MEFQHDPLVGLVVAVPDDTHLDGLLAFTGGELQHAVADCLVVRPEVAGSLTPAVAVTSR